MLQKMSEIMEYSELLDKAAQSEVRDNFRTSVPSSDRLH